MQHSSYSQQERAFDDLSHREQLNVLLLSLHTEQDGTSNPDTRTLDVIPSPKTQGRGPPVVEETEAGRTGFKPQCFIKTSTGDTQEHG